MLHQQWALSPEMRVERLLQEQQTLLRRMTPAARAVFEREMLPALQRGEIPPVCDRLWEVDYVRKPVSVPEFLLGKDYLGPQLRGFVYPKIVDDLEELFEGDYTEVVLGGGIGWGKSRKAELGILYDIYRVSCLRVPAAAYGLIPGSTLAFLNVSVNKTQAQKVLFSGLFGLMKQCPYFRDVFPYMTGLTTEIRLPNNITCYPVAGNETSLLGEGVFSAAFDEMNFMAVVERSKANPEGGTYDQAVALYKRMKARLRSRLNARGRLPGKLWLISSARYPSDFTERMEEEAKTDKHIFVRKYASWETKPATSFLSETFKVEVGDRTKRSRVLDGSETDVNPARVVDVPVDYKEDFDKEPDQQVRDVLGISVLSIRPFISLRHKIKAMFDRGTALQLQHPFSNFDVTLQREEDYLVPEKLPWRNVPVLDEFNRIKTDAAGVPIIRRKMAEGLWFCHNDLAKNRDAAGQVHVRAIGSKMIPRLSGAKMTFERRPVMVVCLCLRVVAPRNGEIDLPQMRSVIYQLKTYGVQFGLITYDSYSSQESIKTLNDLGYTAEEYSVDTSNDAYEDLKSALYDDRLSCYYVEKLEEELANLIFDEKRQKVDHPTTPGASKDLADGLAAAVHHCEANWLKAEAATLAPRPGMTDSGIRAGARDERQEELLRKIEMGLPLTEEEINAL